MPKPRQASPAPLGNRLVPATLPLFTIGVYLSFHGGAGGIGVLLLIIAAAAGPLLAASSPSCLHATLLAAILAGLFVGVLGTVRLHTVTTGEVARAVPVQIVDRHSLRSKAVVPLETLSIVLPCAYEGNNAVRTVDSIWRHTNHSRLKEFIIVDDGSNPPLSDELPADLLNGERVGVPVHVLRQPKTLGLIAAKKRGGDACKGDVIVFLDCHVAPNDGWDVSFLNQMKRAGDHRTVVVPMITTLDPETWLEVPTGPKSYACYVLWNGDFTWLSNAGRDVPLMSGGLLALSRKWWEETGGLDDRMIAWGGENIDQSIRAWLCGGRIELAENASIAHMWRDAKNPKTNRKFPMPTEDVMRNKARAIAAWFDEFKEKAFAFPEYEDIVAGHNPMGSMSHFDNLKRSLSCKPFTWYIQRFDYVYIKSGLIPEEVFQIREEHTGRCLERTLSTELRQGGVILAPCAGAGDTAELQMWHASNRDRNKTGGPCCSGMANWNFLTCLNTAGLGSPVTVFECDIAGTSDTQAFRMEDQQIAYHGGKGCLAPAMPTVAYARRSNPGACKVKVAEVSTDVFRLMSTDKAPAGLEFKCGAAVAAKSASGQSLGFQNCEGSEPEQQFHGKHMLGGIQVRLGEGDMCLDAAGGGDLIVYPCYEESAANYNQIFNIVDGQLVWKGDGSNGYCVDIDEQSLEGAQGAIGKLKLGTCVPKAGQRLARDDQRNGTFRLRDQDTSECLVGQGDSLKMGGCSDDQRWRELKDQIQVQHVPSGNCIDAGDEETAILYPCHTPIASRKQRFRASVKLEFPAVRMDKGWEDNGRRVYFEKCLDHKAEAPMQLAVRRCPGVKERGVRFTRVGARVPPEAVLWQKAVKPPPGEPPLGGDVSPP